MQVFRIVFAIGCAAAEAFAQDSPAPSASGSSSAQQPSREAQNAATRAVRHRFSVIVARSIAYFHISDTIDENLMAQGMGLTGEVLVLRLRLETELDRTDEALSLGDLAAAGKSLDRAQALLDRYASKLGG